MGKKKKKYEMVNLKLWKRDAEIGFAIFMGDPPFEMSNDEKTYYLTIYYWDSLYFDLIHAP